MPAIVESPINSTEGCNIFASILGNRQGQQSIQSGVIQMGLSDHKLIYCSKKTSLLKLNEHCECEFKQIN